MSETEFTIFWIWASFFLTGSYALFFWFALRCGMFKDQDRARHLPLWAEVPPSAEFRVQSSEFRVEEKTKKEDQFRIGVPPGA